MYYKKAMNNCFTTTMRNQTTGGKWSILVAPSQGAKKLVCSRHYCKS